MTDRFTQKILDTSIALSAEKDSARLLEMILTVAMDITRCDAGTLYILEEDQLHFHIMITKSMGGRIDTKDLPPVALQKSNVCACATLENRIINLPDVYQNEVYDFSGPKKYDALTGYKTTSMMVIPMTDTKGHCIGVIQLINALSEEGEVMAFDPQQEPFIAALTSQAAISLTNTNQQIEIENLLLSLIRVLSTAIYERTPYNVTHTQNMSRYLDRFLDWLAEHSDKYAFTTEERRQLSMSVWLHDVGKLTVPLEVMNKKTRLGDDLEKILTRLELIDLTAQLNETRGGAPYAPIKQTLARVSALVQIVNTSSYLNDDLAHQVKLLQGYRYIDQHGKEQPWFTEKELASLGIRAGTLTAEERKVMETHVVMTERILNQVSFGKEYKMVATYASQHHEFLNGTGYPNGLTAEQLGVESRILTIIDVFDGLSATDRPYKQPIPIDRVFSILWDMVEEGKLDGDILGLFQLSRVWEENDESTDL